MNDGKQKQIGGLISLSLANWAGRPHYKTKMCHEKEQRKLYFSERGITEQNFTEKLFK